CLLFFFQAEDGIRDPLVTGVQTCALPISRVESAKAETRAVTGTLDATFRGILAQAEKPEWVGYGVDQIAGERSVCCGNWNDEGRSEERRVGKECRCGWWTENQKREAIVQW